MRKVAVTWLCGEGEEGRGKGGAAAIFSVLSLFFVLFPGAAGRRKGKKR